MVNTKIGELKETYPEIFERAEIMINSPERNKWVKYENIKQLLLQYAGRDAQDERFSGSDYYVAVIDYITDRLKI